MEKTLMFVNKSPNPDPEYKCVGDSGFDLRAWVKEDEGPIILKSLERRLIHTGIYLQLPKHCEAQVRPRSGCALKMGLGVLNSPGTLDNLYFGEVCVIAINLSNEDITINNGDRIAQVVVANVLDSTLVEMVKIDEINDSSERGANGFGSTGMK